MSGYSASLLHFQTVKHTGIFQYNSKANMSLLMWEKVDKKNDTILRERTDV